MPLGAGLTEDAAAHANSSTRRVEVECGSAPTTGGYGELPGCNMLRQIKKGSEIGQIGQENLVCGNRARQRPG